MGRRLKYASNAERPPAYRQRKRRALWGNKTGDAAAWGKVGNRVKARLRELEKEHYESHGRGERDNCPWCATEREIERQIEA